MRGSGRDARGLPTVGCPLRATLRPPPGPWSLPVPPAHGAAAACAPLRAPSAGLLDVRIATRSRTRAKGGSARWCKHVYRPYR